MSCANDELVMRPLCTPCYLLETIFYKLYATNNRCLDIITYERLGEFKFKKRQMSLVNF